MDKIAPELRSKVMASIRGRDTRPEILVRSLLHRMGYRFTVRNRKLPGSPDVCLPKWRAVVFVHGCFWHQHRPCTLARMPRSNLTYWRPKFERNRKRDREALRALRYLGWRTLVIWECQLDDLDSLIIRVTSFLRSKAVPRPTLARIGVADHPRGRRRTCGRDKTGQ